MNDHLKKTPLAETHVSHGARMVDFGGWLMPVQYKGLMEEHQAVRTKVGLFDVSHMGEARVTGEGSEAFLNYLTVNDVTAIEDGQAQYTVMVNDAGCVIDDLLIYRFSPQEYLLVINASTQEKDLAWIRKQAQGHPVTITNESDLTGQIAIQGPLAQEVLGTLVSFDLEELSYYRFRQTEVAGIPALVSRTGYTGEDGFECYVAAEKTAELWQRLMEAGGPHGIQPAGLGARDTLRLEARMHLYGNDMDETTTVLEAGLGWVTKLKKPCDFIGKDALIRQKKEKLTRKLIGFQMIDRGIARHGYPVVEQDKEIGRVTSGSHSPSLKKSIGLAYVPRHLSKPGTEISIQIRNRAVSAVVVKGPFYQRT